MARISAADVVIGADGPRSAVAAAIGCANRDLVETRQITVALLQPHDATDIFLSPRLSRRLWLAVPQGRPTPILALASSRKTRARLKPLLDRPACRPAVAQGRVGAEILAITGGAIPVGGIAGLRGQLGDTAGASGRRCRRPDQSDHRRGHRCRRRHRASMAGDAAAATGRRATRRRRGLRRRGARDLCGPSLGPGRRAAAASCWRSRRRRPAALRRAWIAYPEYWADAAPISPTATEADRHDLSETRKRPARGQRRHRP